MIGTLAKLYAYSRWPKATFMVTHPKTSARLAKMQWDLQNAYAPRVAAITTAVIAIPFGYMVGKALRPDPESSEEA